MYTYKFSITRREANMIIVFLKDKSVASRIQTEFLL